MTLLQKIGILIWVLTAIGNQCFLRAQDWKLEAKVQSDLPDALDFAGISIDISESWMVMGAWWDDMNDRGGGVNSTGAVYLYQKVGEKWDLVQKLYSVNPEVLGYFGFDVAIEGSTLVVGAYNEDGLGGNLINSGAVYVYEMTMSGSWQGVQKLVAPDQSQADFFGFTVALSQDRILIGAPKQNHDLSGQNELTGAGAAYVFERQNGIWDFSQKLIASDRNMDDEFGKFLDISNNYIIIGAEDQDQGFAFDAGAAYIFEYDASINSWNEKQQLFASDATAFKDFGWDVAIDGDNALVGASSEILRPDGSTGANTGAIYAFHRSEQGIWLETQKIFTPDFAQNDFFGRSIDLQGSYAIVGADMEDEDQLGQLSVSGAGSAYDFRRENDEWNFEKKLIGTDRQIDDLFGGAVAIDWPHIAVGASQADIKVNGNNINDAGAGYIFSADEMTTAIRENGTKRHYQISPNPSHQFLTITSFAAPPLEISIYSATGLYLSDLPTHSETHDLSFLAPGIYFIRILSSDNDTTMPWSKY